jgi:hypothetical protein
MKNYIATVEAKVSEDTRERWHLISTRVPARVENYIQAKVRHIILGCSQCKSDEVAGLLVNRYQFLHREVAALLTLMVEEYRLSDEGHAELEEQKHGKVFVFLHDRTTGEPLDKPKTGFEESDDE